MKALDLDKLQILIQASKKIDVSLPKALVTDKEVLWLHLVEELCVKGGSRLLENLKLDCSKYSVFMEEVSLKGLRSLDGENTKIHLETAMRKATRFYKKQSVEVLICLSRFDEIYKLLMDNIDDKKLREKLVEMNIGLKWKSISDYLIEIGKTKDMIAFDSRIINILNKYFGLNLKQSKIQSNHKIYIEIEDSIRNDLKSTGLSLSYMDRIMYKLSGMSAIDYILKNMQK
jgi:thermostable 8-oxoguanine DNA glycosylase